MLQIAICDDEPLLLDEIEKETRQCLSVQKIFSVISAYTSGENLLYEIEDGASFDLLLLDIELPGLSGMELARRIHELLPYALILFVTAHYKYAVDAYELNIFRYIPKNQLKERLPHALRDAAAVLEIQNTDSYLISNQNRVERIPLKDVLYILRDGKNAVFHLRSPQSASMPGRFPSPVFGGKTGNLRSDAMSAGKEQAFSSTGNLAGRMLHSSMHNTTGYPESSQPPIREYRIRKTLTEIYEELDRAYFVFTDRGCIVNLHHISRIAGSVCELTDGTMLPVALSRTAELKKKLNEFWRNMI